MNNLNVEYVPIDSIKPYSRNARKHDKKSVEAIKASIKEFGMSDPVGVWKDEIVEGHGRVIACKELGFSEIPIIRLDHLTDEQRRAYALAHNKTAELSEWDFDVLGGELDDIFDIDMGEFGFADEIGEYPNEDELDADTSADDKTVARLVFQTYKDYAKHEDEIKDFAESIGAAVTVGK